MRFNCPLLFIGSLIALTACGGGGDDPASNLVAAPVPAPDPIPDPIVGDDESLASNGCTNVVIAEGIAYAACGAEIEVAQLDTLERALFFNAADDITIDAGAGLLFTQAGALLTTFGLSDPFAPDVLSSNNTNFSAFSGLSAANGILVISGGAGNSDTQVYTYSDTSEPISLATDGIPAIDNTTGNPDVHVTASSDGITAFYSQDIGAVANFAIQIADINSSGQAVNVSQDIVLTPGGFNFSTVFVPANFPVESEFLNDRLYIAHFAAQGVEVIDLANNNTLLPVIPLTYEPTNIATDGEMLFVVGVSHDTVDMIDPATSSVVASFTPSTPFGQPVGVAASATHIAVADRVNGLVIIARE